MILSSRRGGDAEPHPAALRAGSVPPRRLLGAVRPGGAEGGDAQSLSACEPPDCGHLRLLRDGEALAARAAPSLEGEDLQVQPPRHERRGGVAGGSAVAPRQPLPQEPRGGLEAAAEGSVAPDAAAALGRLAGLPGVALVAWQLAFSAASPPCYVAGMSFCKRPAATARHEETPVAGHLQQDLSACIPRASRMSGARQGPAGSAAAARGQAGRARRKPLRGRAARAARGLRPSKKPPQGGSWMTGLWRAGGPACPEATPPCHGHARLTKKGSAGASDDDSWPHWRRSSRTPARQLDV